MQPEYCISEEGDLLKSEIQNNIGHITKFIKLSLSKEEFTISYKISDLKRTISSVRLGNFTLSPEFSRNLKVILVMLVEIRREYLR